MRIRISTFVRWVAVATLIVSSVLLYSFYSDSDEDTSVGNAAPVRFESAPDAVVRTCRQAQAQADFAVLCPTKLPRQERGAVGCRPPPTPVVQRLRNGPRMFGVDVQGGLLHFGVLGAGGRDVMGPMESWKALGRRSLAGRSGRLYYSPPDGMSYHSGHLVFLFEVGGHRYAASLHAHGDSNWDRDDLDSLERLIAGLRPATRLTLPGDAPPGALGSRVVGLPIGIYEVSDVALGAGRVWAGSYTTSKVFPIRDGAAGEPVRVPPNPFEGLLVHDGKLWVASGGADSVAVIDATSGTRLHTVDVGDGPQDLVLLDGTLWVLNVLDASLTPLDPATGEIVDGSTEVPGRPVALDAGFGRLWMIDCRGGSLLGVDPGSGRVVSRLEIGGGANDVVAFAGSVWVSKWRSHSVIRVDPDGTTVEAEIDAGDTPGELAGGPSGLWVADTRGTKVLRISPRSNRVAEAVEVGDAPTALAVGPRIVWVVDRNNLLRIRIGTAL